MKIDPRRLDLNLLRVFDAVFEDRNVLRAGRRLHLSQSAISHALSRLREALGDELFVRTGRGMEPTARALAMAEPLRDALRGIYDTLGVRPFEPRTEARTFVVAANDYVTAVLLTRLDQHIAAVAPQLNLVVRPSTRLDLAAQIDVGRIDVAIGVFAEIPSRLQSVPLWSQQETLLMRKGHPLRRRKPRLADLADFPLVTVTVGGQEEGAVGGYIAERGLARQSEMFDRQALEDALTTIGRTPRFRAMVPHSLAVPALLSSSDMLSIVPAPLADWFAARGDVRTGALPYPAPRSTLRALWHRRHDADPGHVWLRDRLLDVARKTSHDGDEAS